MDKEKDYYLILGIARNAEDIVVKAAYRALAQRHHPDRSPTDEGKANERRMSEINEAYEILSNPKLREEYNTQCNSLQADSDSIQHAEQVSPRVSKYNIDINDINYRSPLVRSIYLVLLLFFYYKAYQEPNTLRSIIKVWFSGAFIWQCFIRK